MKIISTLLLMTVTCFVSAQTNWEQNHEVQGISKVAMDFEYPELINVKSYDGSEVKIQASISINQGENDDAFEVVARKEGNKLLIFSKINNLESLPKRIVIQQNGKKYFFKTSDYNDPKIKNFIAENGNNHEYMMHGVIKEIKLTLFIPKNLEVEVNSKFGMVEVSDITKPLTVISKHGGIDITLDSGEKRNITAKTKFGEIYSDLDLIVDKAKSESGNSFDWITVVASVNNGGPNCNLESKFGNVYIRKK